MSFFGLKYKKVNAENISAVIPYLELDENSKKLMGAPESLSIWTQNGDGSIQYKVVCGAENLLDQRIPLNEAQDQTSADGSVSKHVFTLEGNVLKSVLTAPGKKTRSFVRTFNGKNMSLEIIVEGVDEKATVTFEAV